MGITVLPQLASVQPYSDMVVTRPFVSPAPTRQIALAWRKSFPRPKVIKVIEQAIKHSVLKK
jgi:LysR family hydrogen peroxide-inducible transcriptional activator